MMALRTFSLLVASLVSFVYSGLISAAADGARVGPAVVQKTEFGPVLATSDGMTLYSWPRDRSTPGESQCTDERASKYRHVTSVDVYFPRPDSRGSCIDKWPPFLASPDAKELGDWSVTQREDGSRQWAFRGMPLHTSIKDIQPGDVNGVSAPLMSYGGWQPVVAPIPLPPGIKLRRSAIGVVVTTDNNRPLYTPTRERCIQCVEHEPLLAGALVNGVGDWGVVRAEGGIRQYTFRDLPLFVGSRPLTGLSGSRLEEPEGWKLVVYQQAAPVPQELDIRFSLIGDVYTDTRGMALYVFHCESGSEKLPCDDPGEAAAYWSIICGAAEVCADNWHPFRAGSDARPSGEWSIVDIPHPVYTDARGLTYDHDNSNSVVRTWAFRGRPVYTYSGDTEPGQLLGHRIGALPGSSFYALRVPGNDDQALAR